MHQRLYLKHRLIGTPAERPLSLLRWVAGAPERMRSPELAAMHHEQQYIDDALAHLLQPAWSCVDGGSHIGSVLAKYLRMCPDGHHLAIEPVAEKAAWLRARYPEAEIHQVALGETAGRHAFFEDRKRPGFSSLQPLRNSDHAAASYEVAVARLDDLVGDRTINFVKLDLEGAELPALCGGRTVIERDLPTILFECGVQTSLDSFGYLRTDVWDFLTDAGYDIYLAQDFVFGRDPMGRDEFRRAGTYPFPGFNYLACPKGTPVTRIR